MKKFLLLIVLAMVLGMAGGFIANFVVTYGVKENFDHWGIEKSDENITEIIGKEAEK